MSAREYGVDDDAGSTAGARGAQSELFSAADAYERFMGRWSRALAPLPVRFGGVRTGEAILDVGSGTGALTAAILAEVPSATVVGIDPVAGYVTFARGRHPEDRVQFEVGDAQQLRFATATFDGSLALLVLNFIPDHRKAFDEMIRVTRPGGSVAAAVCDCGEEMEMLRIFWGEAVAIDPAAGPRDERHMPLCRDGELATLWRDIGSSLSRKRH